MAEQHFVAREVLQVTIFSPCAHTIFFFISWVRDYHKYYVSDGELWYSDITASTSGIFSDTQPIPKPATWGCEYAWAWKWNPTDNYWIDANGTSHGIYHDGNSAPSGNCPGGSHGTDGVWFHCAYQAGTNTCYRGYYWNINRTLSGTQQVIRIVNVLYVLSTNSYITYVI